MERPYAIDIDVATRYLDDQRDRFMRIATALFGAFEDDAPLHAEALR